MVDLIVLALATYRVVLLLSLEAGPYNVFGWLRRKLLAVVPYPLPKPYLTIDEYVSQLPMLAQLLICPKCLSVWVAVGMWGIWLSPDLRGLVWVLAISGGVVLALKVGR